MLAILRDPGIPLSQVQHIQGKHSMEGQFHEQTHGKPLKVKQLFDQAT